MKEIEPFYLNIRLLNKSEVISNKVAEKVGTNVFARAAASVASRVVSDATVVSKFSDTLVEKIYVAVESMGIECELIKRFAQGPMVCFKVCITSVDQMQLVLAAKGPEFASGFSTLLGSLSSLGLSETALPKIEIKIGEKVSLGMRTKFQELIPTKMLEQGLEVEVKCCSVEEQAEVFFDMLDSC